LIIQNADPNLQDFFGDTPMHIAARNTNFEKVLEFMREIV
jgi:ankyrin repeat protein